MRRLGLRQTLREVEMDEPKTVGDLLARAVQSRDREAIAKAMQTFWSAAALVGLPTPADEEIDAIIAEGLTKQPE